MNLPTGKGLFIWQAIKCQYGNPVNLANAALAANLSHVAIKVSDGTGDYNVSANLPAIIGALREIVPGIAIYGWSYFYGVDPLGEAKRAVNRSLALKLDGFIVDAELEFKQPGKAIAARQVMAGLRAGFGASFPIGLSTYRYPTYHPAFPFKEFLERSDFIYPQMYWMFEHNPAAQLERCVREYRAISRLPIIPAGAAWKQGGWAVTPADVAEFMNKCRTLGLSGASFWSWQHAEHDLPKVWDAIALYKWPKPPPPDAEMCHICGRPLHSDWNYCPYDGAQAMRGDFATFPA